MGAAGSATHDADSTHDGDDIHIIDFLTAPAVPLRIRMGVASYDHADGEPAADCVRHVGPADQTGCYLWSASLALACWLAADAAARELVCGRAVLELGAGCGLPGLTAACCGRARRVVLTDLAVTTLENLRVNAAANQPTCEAWCAIEVHALDWADEHPTNHPAFSEPVEVIIGSDVACTRLALAAARFPRAKAVDRLPRGVRADNCLITCRQHKGRAVALCGHSPTARDRRLLCTRLRERRPLRRRARAAQARRL
jgi:predicted nicotinamide N-methyase